MIPKFRAWKTIGTNEMFHNVVAISWNNNKIAVLYPNPGRNTFRIDEESLENVILMQSTGMKDKNGVEIFEGDVVSVSVRNGFDYLDNKVCIVKNSIDYSGLVCATVDEDLEYRIFNTELFEEYMYEVIGNIYENSELLEEQR
ncbi:YopX family protein [Enterococcus durans]|uniref:YopX family protein n=1 Tax=Enterococcus durans TaxID=53345 RepID=UPI00288DE746|nr:YopX family protein [Enterococcus durans]MDT2772717.1 YopX family protein [Enterococcus durans]